MFQAIWTLGNIVSTYRASSKIPLPPSSDASVKWGVLCNPSCLKFQHSEHFQWHNHKDCLYLKISTKHRKLALNSWFLENSKIDPKLSFHQDITRIFQSSSLIFFFPMWMLGCTISLSILLMIILPHTFFSCF